MAYSKWKDIGQVERYASGRYRSWDQHYLDRREKKLVRWLFHEHKLSGTILDIPVGYGRFQPLLSEFGSVLAADVGFLPVLYQKQSVGLAQGSVISTAENLPFTENSVDVIFCFRLIQHMHEVEERVAILKQFNRVSRKWVVVSLYLSNPLHTFHRSIVRQPSRITMLTKSVFEKEVRESGLNIERIISVLPGLHAHRISLLSTEGTT